MDVLLELKSVSKSYKGSTPSVVLRAASLRVAAGESLAIVGPSGSGKTTVLNLLGGLDSPDSGEVLFQGAPLSAMKPDVLARWRREKAGFVFQHHCLLPQCTALENVLLPTLADASEASEALVDRARRLLARVGLEARSAHFPSQLSGGERQRVALVRALILHPALVLADEPTGALDHANAVEVGRLLIELNREEHVTLVVVTHSAELAAKMARRAILRDGAFVPENETVGRP
jgi:lipoprotein-releasing system ATP-binding protein